MSGAYYGTPNSVVNGHPADTYGWAAAAGIAFNLQGGDQIGVNVCYSEGDVGHCTNNNFFQFYNSNTSVGLGWTTDGVFGTGTEIQRTRVWSALAGYQHIWSPKWRSSLFGGYVNVDYGGAATALINGSQLAVSPGVAGLAGSAGVNPCFAAVPGAGAATFATVTPLAGNSCSPDSSWFEIGTRTQWNPVAQLDIGLEVLYTHYNTAFKGPALVAATGSRPAVALIDDQEVWSAMFRWQRNFYP
jgi:hypothetical protein